MKNTPMKARQRTSPRGHNVPIRMSDSEVALLDLVVDDVAKRIGSATRAFAIRIALREYALQHNLPLE